MIVLDGFQAFSSSGLCEGEKTQCMCVCFCVVALGKAGSMAVKWAESIVANRKDDVKELILNLLQSIMKENMAKYLVSCDEC